MNPLAICIAERQQMITAALTLIRYYLSSDVDRPGPGRMASFETWDDWVRQTIVYIDQELAPGQFGDIMEKVWVNQVNDPDQEALGTLLHALQVNFGTSLFTASDVCKKAKETSFSNLEEDQFSAEAQLYDAMEGFKTGRGDLTSKSLGRILMYRKDRIVDGLSLEKEGEIKGISRWRVRRHETAEI